MPTINGTAGNDTLNGTPESDTINGLSGDDTLKGGEGGDALNGGAGNDLLDGGGSRDSASYMGATGGVTVSLAILGPQNTGAAGVDTLANIENLGGTQFADVLIGNEGANVIEGEYGAADLIIGGGGDDMLSGGAGSHFVGGEGNDIIFTSPDSQETIEFHAGDGQDRVYDIRYNDVVDIPDYASAQSITQIGSDVVVQLSDTDQITFKNSNLTTVHAAMRFADAPKIPESLTAQIASGRPADVVLSPDGATLYVADTDGDIRVYDVESRALLDTWEVGNQLGGMDVSPDGTYLLIAERQPVSHQPATGTTDATTTLTSYKVLTATGEVTSVPVVVTGTLTTGFYDVEIFAGGRARLTHEMYSQPVRELDVSSGQYSLSGAGYGGRGVLIGSNDDTQALFSSQLQTPPELVLFGATGFRLDYWSGHLTSDPTYEARGITAFSLEAGLAVQQQYSVDYVGKLGTNLLVFNSALDEFFDLGDLHPRWIDGRISGLAFDSTGNHLFVLDDDTDTIVQLATADWSIVRSFNVGTDIGDFAEGDFGNRLLVTGDDRYFIVTTATGVQLVENDALANNFAGTAGDDYLSAGIGDDHLSGLAGNDTLEGGAGDDTLDGGEGNDTASYASASDWVGVHLSSANPQDTAGAGLDTLLSIENLIGSGFSDILSGNDGANRLEGGAGFDVLIGGLGNDTLDGGEGADEANYLSAPSAVNVNLALSGPQNTGGAGVDTLVSIESVRGSQYDDVMRGNAGDNGLVGQGGDDWLFGGAGNDALNGTDGYDRMYGGAGNDIYYVSDDTDFAYELADEGQDFVLAWVDHQLRDNVEDLQLMTNGTGLIGKGNALDNGLIGNDFGNRLYGYDGNDLLSGNGGDDWLFGGGGNDYLSGLAGYDRMYGGTGNDTYAVSDATDYAYENAGEGIDKVIATINHSLRANIENLQLDGSSDLRGYGNSLNNVIDGNYGNNLLYGRDGDDDLRGYAGNDILYGEAGDDLLQGGSGQDRFYGGAGADTFLFRTNDFAGMTSSTADRIHDFNPGEGDRIDLGEVDANALEDGFQAYDFIGSAAFSGTAGELRYQQASGQTYVQLDIDGDGDADLAIRIDGLHDLQGSAFII